MSTQPESQTSTDRVIDHVNHYVCECNEDIALCGKNVKDTKFVDLDYATENDCPLCLWADETTGCLRCD